MLALVNRYCAIDSDGVDRAGIAPAVVEVYNTNYILRYNVRIYCTLHQIFYRWVSLIGTPEEVPTSASGRDSGIADRSCGYGGI